MIGVLALQGDFEKHKIILDKIGVNSLYVKSALDLARTDALIIPGGESSSFSRLMDTFSIRKAISNYSKSHSIFGTCAGMIMLSSSKSTYQVKTLNVMDFSVTRNSWGSQKYSFEEKVDFKNFGLGTLNAVFIRAPKVLRFGKGIKRIEYYKNEPILLEDDMHLACSFHPEIEDDLKLHKYFLMKCHYE